MAGKGKTLRFAALIRVSTEKQEKQGESLRTQTIQIKDAVKRLGGGKVTWYGGQEHATPGHEKNEVDRLISDSRNNKCDVVIVAHEDRWSRDNIKSTQGLDTFQAHKVKFFVGTRECNLSDPTIRFMLAQHAVIGQYHAENQAKKSIESRIERAKRGIPTSGKLPFGRLFNKVAGKWGIDEDKKAIVQDVAKRYLAGEKMPDLAEEHGLNHSNLHKVLTKRSGTDWEEKFDYPKFDIHAVVKFTIPRLLPEKTIEAIRKRAKFNRTYVAGYTKHPYLLARYIFCDHCGYTLFGQTNHPNTDNAKKQYYRHLRKGERPCSCKAKTWIDAAIIEANVLEQLFEMFGNPKAVERAIEEAIPNREEIIELRERQTRLETSLTKLKKSKQRVVKLAADGVLSDDEISEQIKDLRMQEAKQQEQLQKINDQLEHLPSAQQIQYVSTDVVEQFQRAMFPTHAGHRKIGLVGVKVNGRKRLSAKLHMKLEEADECIENMAWKDKRSLIESVFAGPTPDGKRAGVYIRWEPGDNDRPSWRYSIRGLIQKELLLPSGSIRGVTQFASHSRGTFPLGCRCLGDIFRLES